MAVALEVLLPLIIVAGLLWFAQLVEPSNARHPASDVGGGGPSPVPLPEVALTPDVAFGLEASGETSRL